MARAKRRYMVLRAPVVLDYALNSICRHLGIPLGTIYSLAINMLYGDVKMGKISKEALISLYHEKRNEYRGKKYMCEKNGYITFEYEFSVKEEIWMKERELMDLIDPEMEDKSPFRYMILKYLIERDKNLLTIEANTEKAFLEHIGG